MRRRARVILALCICALAHSNGLGAQDAGDVRGQIAALLAAAAPLPDQPAARAHGAAQALQDLYRRSANSPLWSHEDRATPQAEALLRELQGAAAYGLRASDYDAAALEALLNAPGSPPTPARELRWAQLDVGLSRAALRFLVHLHYGRVDPAVAGFHLAAGPAQLDLVTTLESLARSSDLRHGLAAVEPPFYHYELLKEALARYLVLAQQPQLTQLPAAAAKLKIGDPYVGAPELRRLLIALGDLSAATAAPAAAVPTFDAQLSAGLRSFQQRHGLGDDGLLGKSTFAALTTPLAQRVRQIELTLERWRWLAPFQTPSIVVNIPQFHLYAFATADDRVAGSVQMDVIVGKVYPRTQTPVFESDMRYVVFRPYWDVPFSITRNEMLPKLRADPRFLEAQHLEIVRGQQDSSPAVPPTAENIAALAAGQLRLRQKPGEDNALGLVKFMFPNSYNVYLHSTPAHRLFAESVRTFSHGCIRVADPVALAQYVLRDTPGDWTREKILAAMNGTQTQRVDLAHPINVLILYGTALATEAGRVMFFNDIYGHDRKLAQQLGLDPIT